MSVEPATLLALSLRLCAVGVLVQSLEVLRSLRELRDDRLLGWAGRRHSSNPLRQWVRRLWGFPGSAVTLGARVLLASSCLTVDYRSSPAFWLIGGLLLAQLYYNRRFTMLAGNSETMFLVCLVAVWAGALPGASVRLQTAALLFVAAHASLAYLVAGAHKLGSPLWRSGAQLQQIAQGGSYRLPAFARRGVSTRRRARLWSRGLIALELALPFAIFFPAPIFWTLLAAGFAFHGLVAVTMGLHGFWWSFAAAYCALAGVHSLLH